MNTNKTPASKELVATPNSKRPPLLQATRLSVLFPLRKRLFSPPTFVHAVENVSLYLRHGETLGLVGESGCGKTTLARALLRLIPLTYGDISLDGEPIQHLSERQLRPLRKHMQMIFQDSAAAMDPRMTVQQIVAEGLVAHRLAKGKKQLTELVVAQLEEVGLSGDLLHRLPGELSGGQRQRVGIARALAVRPRLLVCDEPTASLDVSVRAQIIELLLRLQQERGLSYLFISHDISVLKVLSHRLAVMYSGRIVEEGPTGQVLSTPKHPYTRALVSAVPSVTPGAPRLRIVLQGEPSDPSALPTGCPFEQRCPDSDGDKCRTEMPQLRPIASSAGHWAACWYAPVRYADRENDVAEQDNPR